MNLETLILLNKNVNEAKKHDIKVINDLIRKSIAKNWVKFSRPIYSSYIKVKNGCFFNKHESLEINDDFFHIYASGLCKIDQDAPEEYVKKFSAEFCKLLKKGRG